MENEETEEIEVFELVGGKQKKESINLTFFFFQKDFLTKRNLMKLLKMLSCT